MSVAQILSECGISYKANNDSQVLPIAETRVKNE